MSTELIAIEKSSVQEVFTQADKLQPILDEIERKAKSIVPDITTAKGRKEVASVAYQVARTKTYLDGLGKDLVADMKKLPALVDASRRQMREFLDALGDEVRKPLTEWEADQERIAAEQKAKEAAEALAKQLENDHEIGLLMNREFDRALADRIAAEAEAKRVHEERIAIEATRAAEAAAAKAIEDAQRREREAKEAAERAEQVRKDAEARAEQDRIDAAARAEQARKDAEAKAEQQRKDADARAEQERIAAAERLAAAERKAEDERKAAEVRQEQVRKEAIEQERQRAAREAKRIADEQAKREADTAYKATINRKAVADLVEMGMTESMAKGVVTAIAKGLISNVTINY